MDAEPRTRVPRELNGRPRACGLDRQGTRGVPKARTMDQRSRARRVPRGLGRISAVTQVPFHLSEMEIKVPLRVAPPPRGRERDEDPTDVPRSDIHVERDAGAVALRVESVRVLDVRGGIARIDRVAERRVEEHPLIDRDPHRTRRTVPQPDLVPGPPQDGARAVCGRSGMLVVVLPEVRPPREDRVSRERRLAIHAELHPRGTSEPPSMNLAS